MPIIAWGLLLICFGEVWYFIRTDPPDYAAFKLLTETRDRQKRYRVWLLKSLVVLLGTSLLGLALLGRLPALKALPPEFDGLAHALRSMVAPQELPSRGFLFGFGGALIGGMLAGIAISKLPGRGKKATVIGDIEPLMPRNWAETLHTFLMSLNAGLSEELFFRLLLPLLLTLVLGNALLAFVLASVVFGAVHAYQGWVGVLATTVLGAAFGALYLWTGNIWIAAAGHALLDTVGLVIRPSIGRLTGRIFADRTPEPGA